MFAVIFEAVLNNPDQDYHDTAVQLQTLAKNYGCVEFVSVCENGHELTVSYWETEEQISNWKENGLHQQAQQKGRERWYKSWNVKVARVGRNYDSSQ